MDIFERIENEHKVQRDLMKKLLDTSGDSDERKELFAQFVTEFLSHAAAEEHAFYAPMLKLPETTEQSRHSVAEHQEAVTLIEELEKTDMSSPGWLVTFKKLAHDNEHHMKEEEKDVFNVVKEEMTESTIDSMLPTFDDRKAEELVSLSKD